MAFFYPMIYPQPLHIPDKPNQFQSLSYKAPFLHTFKLVLVLSLCGKIKPQECVYYFE